MYFPIYLFQFPTSPAPTRPRCLCPCRPRSILQDNGRQVFQLADSHRGWTWWCEQVWQRGPSQPRPCAKSLHYPAESTSWHSQPLRWTRNTHCHSPQSLTQAFYFFFLKSCSKFAAKMAARIFKCVFNKLEPYSKKQNSKTSETKTLKLLFAGRAAKETGGRAVIGWTRWARRHIYSISHVVAPVSVWRRTCRGERPIFYLWPARPPSSSSS